MEKPNVVGASMNMRPFDLTARGMHFEATFEVEGTYLIVRSAYGTMRAPLGLSPRRRLARVLLRRILREAGRLPAKDEADSADETNDADDSGANAPSPGSNE